MSGAVWSVSWWSEAERFWQFAGEGGKAWAVDARARLLATGHRARMRRIR